VSRYFRDISREASKKTNAWIGNTQGARSTVARAFDFLTRETKRAMALIGVKNVDELRARGDDVVRERRR
jgi:isopentenyl diphosphate isomerase/L-lactate dehydrogenase-like FMN-dependent dehydrogenase